MKLNHKVNIVSPDLVNKGDIFSWGESETCSTDEHGGLQLRYPEGDAAREAPNTTTNNNYYYYWASASLRSSQEREGKETVKQVSQGEISGSLTLTFTSL